MMKATAAVDKKNRILAVVRISALISGLICLLTAWPLGQRFFEGYFFGSLIVMSIPAGSLGIWLIHTLTGGAWGEPLRKYYQAGVAMLPVAFLIGMPNAFWLDRIFQWARSPDLLEDGKSAYLNVPFFIVRSVVYFAVWCWMAASLRRGKTAWAGLFMVLYIFTGTFFSVDWVMSLDYQWYSSIYGMLFVTGQALLAFGLMIAGHVFLDDPDGETSGRWLHDLGNLLLTMVMVWAYLSFSQFLIIWMGNLPEEIRWYLPRVKGAWGAAAVLLIVVHFFIPFALLLRRVWKMNPQFLLGVALLVVVMHLIDIAWLVFPSLGRAVCGITVTHIAAMISTVCLSMVPVIKGLKTDL